MEGETATPWQVLRRGNDRDPWHFTFADSVTTGIGLGVGAWLVSKMLKAG